MEVAMGWPLPHAVVNVPLIPGVVLHQQWQHKILVPRMPNLLLAVVPSQHVNVNQDTAAMMATPALHVIQVNPRMALVQLNVPIVLQLHMRISLLEQHVPIALLVDMVHQRDYQLQGVMVHAPLDIIVWHPQQAQLNMHVLLADMGAPLG